MSPNDRKEIAALLRAAMPPARRDLETDLWPRMLRRLDREPRRAGWLDWALLGGAAAWCVAFPGVIAALMYQL